MLPTVVCAKPLLTLLSYCICSGYPTHAGDAEQDALTDCRSWDQALVLHALHFCTRRMVTSCSKRLAGCMSSSSPRVIIWSRAIKALAYSKAGISLSSHSVFYRFVFPPPISSVFHNGVDVLLQGRSCGCADTSSCFGRGRALLALLAQHHQLGYGPRSPLW